MMFTNSGWVQASSTLPNSPYDSNAYYYAYYDGDGLFYTYNANVANFNE